MFIYIIVIQTANIVLRKMMIAIISDVFVCFGADIDVYTILDLMF